MPGASSGKDLGVYDFVDEKEVKHVEKCVLSRFAPSGNPNPSSSAAGTSGGLDRHTFLHYFQTGVNHNSKEHGGGILCVEIDESDEEVDHEAKCEASMDDADEESPIIKDEKEDMAGRNEERESLMEEEAGEDGPLPSPRDTGENCGTGNAFMKSSAPEELLGERSFGATGFISFVGDSKDDQVASERSDDEDETDRALDADGLCGSSMSPSSSYGNAENEGYEDQLGINGCFTGLEEGDMDTEVNISVEYFTYGDNYYGESQLTFLTDSIKVTCKDGSGGNCISEFEWSIANLVLINCHWSQTVETALVEVRLKPTSINECDGSRDSSGTLRLNFTVLGSQWVRKEQKITSLAPAYKNAWRTERDFNGTLTPDDGIESVSLFSRQYISDAEVVFEDIIYPKGDPDAVCISRRDIELLKPETFLNDTIIDFYIKFLKDKINPEDRDKYHFFNSFFFRKLADLDKDRGCTLEGRAAFLRVRKWTRKIDIFGKDYIFIPVNFNLHWSLVVICHPGEIFGFKEVELNKKHRVPCILHMDSIKGSHQGLKNHIQSYLWEEWKERHPDSSVEISDKFLNLRFASLELPQQENSFDCGLFLLHYVELFLKDAPANFNIFKIPESSHFLNLNWFIPAEASCKRFLIRELLYKLYRGEGINSSLFSVNDGLHSSVVSMSNIDNGTPSHGLQSSSFIPDTVEPCKNTVSGVDEHMGTSTFVNTLGDKEGNELLLSQLLETGRTGISSDLINFRQFGLIGSSHTIIEGASEPLGCFNAEKDKVPYVDNGANPGMCLISLAINTAADWSKNPVTANDVKDEDDHSLMQEAQALVGPTGCRTSALTNANVIFSEAEDLNRIGVADKSKSDLPRHLQQVPSGHVPFSISVEVPVETAGIKDSQEAGLTYSVGCLNQETPQLKLVFQEDVQEPEKPHGSDGREGQDAAKESTLIVEDSENEETDALPTNCDELLENNVDPDTSSHLDVVPVDNRCPFMDNDELGKVEEMCLVPEDQRPAKCQKISHCETGRRRTRKYVN